MAIDKEKLNKLIERDDDEDQYVYLFKVTVLPKSLCYYKIGISKDVDKRKKRFETAFKQNWSISSVQYIQKWGPTPFANKIERIVHAYCSKKRLNNFQLEDLFLTSGKPATGHTELFDFGADGVKDNQADLDHVKKVIGFVFDHLESQRENKNKT